MHKRELVVDEETRRQAKIRHRAERREASCVVPGVPDDPEIHRFGAPVTSSQLCECGSRRYGDGRRATHDELDMASKGRVLRPAIGV